MNLTSYRTLGKSGLIVSPFALGTMTFGASRWGASETTSRALFDAYADAAETLSIQPTSIPAARARTCLAAFSRRAAGATGS